MRRSISPKQRLSVTLCFLATGESYRSLKFSTRIPACTLSRIMPKTCRVLYEVLRNYYMQMPEKKRRMGKVVPEYLHLWNVPNYLGAIDGKHINFKVPLSEGPLYYNYKGTNSIVLLALVDAQYRFLYVYAETNGRVSDGGVFRDSDLASLLGDTNNPLNIPQSKPLPGMKEEVPHIILADAAFPLQTNILKPYPSNNLTHNERIYNYRLSRGHRVVENAFGIVANRFRVLFVLSTMYS